MKRRLCVAFVLCVLVSVGWTEASITKTYERDRFGDNNDAAVTWDFETEVGNYLGYNLDYRNWGMEGIGKFSMETQIRRKNDELFFNPGKLSGAILVEDLEVKFTVDDLTMPEESSEMLPVNISWGDVSGMVYLGSFYIRLNYNNHDRVDLVDNLDDEDLEFSNINYSILSLRDTAIYKASDSNAVGDVIRFDIDEERGIVGRDFVENANGSVNVGFLVGDLLDLRLGASTREGFLNQINYDYNPFSLSGAMKLYFDDYRGYSYFVYILKSSISSGIGGKPFLETGNPLNLATALRYNLPIDDGRFHLIPSVGFEVSMQYEKKLASELQFFSSDPDPVVTSPDERRNDWVFTQQYEAMGGLILDWSGKGRSREKGDFLNFKTGSDDIVSDGASIAVGFGYMPNELFRELVTPYLGIKFALWDSEEPNERGIIPFVESAVILNFNHSFGGRVDDFHKDVLVYQDTKESTHIIIGERTDVGIGAQLKFDLNYFKPYGNVIFKNLDIFFIRDTYSIETFHLEEARTYNNKADFRMKLGLELDGLIQHMVFDAYWESGDLVKDDVTKETLTDYDYFSNENAVGDTLFVSHAKYGVIAIGAKVKF